MDESRRLADSGHGRGEAFVVLADSQTSGRGRVEGRSWEGTPGASLFMTLCLPAGSEAGEALPLRVALGLRNALLFLKREAGENGTAFKSGLAERLLIKWPNDLMGMIEGDEGGWRKLGGILCETATGRIHVGIGLNLKPGAFSKALASRAVCIETLTGSPCPQAERLALRIAESVLAALPLQEWKNGYESAMWARGRAVEFLEGHPESGLKRRGFLEGIDGSGRLVLRGSDGVRTAFLSGEIGRLLLLQSPDRE